MKLSPAQRRMVLASEPCDLTRNLDEDQQEGVGVELRTGADYAVAKALTRLELGAYEGPGGPLPGMYWNNADGLFWRSTAEGKAP